MADMKWEYANLEIDQGEREKGKWSQVFRRPDLVWFGLFYGI